MTTLTLRTPRDIISAVPHMIGFHPTDSLVVMVPGARPSIGRVDMLTLPGQQVEMVNAFAPLYDSGRPMLALTYTLDDAAADSVVALLRERGEVLTHIRVHAGTYRADDNEEEVLTPSDRIDATMIYHGSAPAPSREALRLPTKISESLAQTLSTGKFDDHTQADEETWVIGRLASHEKFTDDELARIVNGFSRFGHRFREVVHTTLDRTEAQQAQWRDAAERVGDGWTEVLVTYAFASWLAGDGSHAWIGLEAVHDSSSERDDALALLIGTALQAGIDPATFEIGTLAEVNEEES